MLGDLISREEKVRIGSYMWLVNQRFSLVSHHGQPQYVQSVIVHRPHYRRCRQHRVVRVDVRRVLGRLLDGFHLGLAVGVVERAYDDGLSQEDVPR